MLGFYILYSRLSGPPPKSCLHGAGQDPWELDFPFPEQPDSINHGSADGFNYSRGLGFVHKAMGVHSAMINGKKQVEDAGQDMMVSMLSMIACCTTSGALSYSRGSTGCKQRLVVTNCTRLKKT